MSVRLYKIFGKAKDVMICTFPINVSPLQPQPLESFLIDFSVDLVIAVNSCPNFKFLVRQMADIVRYIKV